MASRDIRDQAGLSGQKVRKLNFIKASTSYRFRKYYRSGLRSHIFEVLDPRAVDQEQTGVMEDGIRVFPRATPLKIFRIFRNRFSSTEEIFDEIQRYKVLLKYLGPGFIARSEEFIADYRDSPEASGILLCGLQEYVEGQILDPWRLCGGKSIRGLLSVMAPPGDVEALTRTAVENICCFTQRIRHLAAQAGYIPDLAGVGNLILTPDGGIRLVDINNIVVLQQGEHIPLDDKGYPACDVSVQVLFLIEQNLLGCPEKQPDPLFGAFLTPERRERVRQIEKNFYTRLGKDNDPVDAY